MKVIEIKEEVKIKQEDKIIVLEAGDKIEIVKEARTVLYSFDLKVEGPARSSSVEEFIAQVLTKIDVPMTTADVELLSVEKDLNEDLSYGSNYIRQEFVASTPEMSVSGSLFSYSPFGFLMGNQPNKKWMTISYGNRRSDSIEIL